MVNKRDFRTDCSRSPESRRKMYSGEIMFAILMCIVV